MLDNDIESYEEARYLFDLGAKDGNNIHCYILKGHIWCGLIFNGKLSQVGYKFDSFDNKKYLL